MLANMDRFRRRSIVRGVELSSNLPATGAHSSGKSTGSTGSSSAPRASPDREIKRFVGSLGIWPAKSNSSLLETGSPHKHVYTRCPEVQKLSSTSLGYQPCTLTKSSPRPPRHTPIIIPGYVSPYEPHQQTPISRSAASVLASSEIDTSETVDSSPSTAAFGVHGRTARCGLLSNPSMNSSQISLSASESGLDSASSSIHLSNSQTNLAATSFSQQNINATNVSSFVCNIHRTSGREPPPLVGATTTVLGDKLYVFGGRIHSKTQSDLSADLYELDLIRRHWTRLDTFGSIPPPRYFHSMCALGDKKLVCYGGMSPATQVAADGTDTGDNQPGVAIMSDIHIYDAPSRKWTLIQPSQTDSPEGRYAHCATVLPSSAVFTTAESYSSAIHNNPSTDDPHSGVLGAQIDGSGGAEMVVVGGQNRDNEYIQQISVFNLRSLKWTSSSPYDRNCGAYKSMVMALPGINAQAIGTGHDLGEGSKEQSGTPMLIYSNYNFLDVRLELQVRQPDGRIEEKQMVGPLSPPGLRFPNGGIINGHFVVSGTYLTSSKHEYALWALDLKTLTWAMIDTAGTIFGQGSWNRGVLWPRRNTYIILGHRKRNLVDDYNARRINFAHMCVVELEAYGLYDNPRKQSPCSAYVSNSAPAIPLSLQQSLPPETAGGRTISAVAAQLGQTVLHLPELSDMEIIAYGGEKIPCNSSILERRWGLYFIQLMHDASSASDGQNMSETNTLRPTMNSRASRISALTITPKTNGSGGEERSQSQSTNRTLVDPGNHQIPAASRVRALYLPHTASTIKLMLQFLYTSALPPLSDPLCSPHALCSLLQMARPYQIDGLQEATIERLHEALEGRNAAGVFNAAAMAAGGGRAIGMGGLGTLEMLERRESAATTVGLMGNSVNSSKKDGPTRKGHTRTGSGDSNSTATSTTTSTSVSDNFVAADDQSRQNKIWTGEHSSVIGLQKRGLRGLIEGRRMREREIGRDSV